MRPTSDVGCHHRPTRTMRLGISPRGLMYGDGRRGIAGVECCHMSTTSCVCTLQQHCTLHRAVVGVLEALAIVVMLAME